VTLKEAIAALEGVADERFRRTWTRHGAPDAPTCIRKVAARKPARKKADAARDRAGKKAARRP
jgi:hypothetical protein